MPDLQSPEPSPGANVPPSIEPVMPAFDEADFAFGCECADPSLQIAYWLQDAGGASA